MSIFQSLTHYFTIVVILTFTAFLIGIQSGRSEAVAVISFERFERGERLTEREFNFLLKEAKWPRNLWAEVKAVAKCESSWRPGAINKKTGDFGLMQVNYESHSDKILAPKYLMNPLTNLKVAWRIYHEARDRGERWGPWRSSNECHGLA